MKDQSVMPVNWMDHPIVAIDTETSGQYPFRDDLCEIAAVKTVGGQVVDTYQSLVKPRHKMSDFIISIHGITNEMVKEAPKIDEVLQDFISFIGDGVCVGHHSPFDLGFLSYDLEKQKISLPDAPVFCSSLVSRNVIKGTANHKLQTLVEHLGIDGGQAHRALDDAKACAEVLFHCLRDKEVNTFEEAFSLQGSPLWWQDFSIAGKMLQSQVWKTLVEAIESGKDLEIIYNGGSQKGKKRQVKPISVVITPSGDFLVASDGGEEPKRFYMQKLMEAEMLL
ncbi:MAG: 3'-5' exonuclease [Bdellovibrionales bacterium]|nr:3'-5' exonuclease [Bdellovibrionales bacterium]